MRLRDKPHRWPNPLWLASGFGQFLRSSCGAALLLSAIAFAAPRVPPSADTVLEHVPAAEATRHLEPLRRQVSSRPDDLAAALALAQGYLDIGRANADPRFVSYAQATLESWMAGPRPNPAVLTLEASTLQYLHRFDDALKLLDRALAAQPANGQAWLIKATILEVQGHFEPARQACRPLARTAGQLIALGCLTSVNSLTGQLEPSYSALNSVFRDDARLAAGVRTWIREQLADMAQRLGDDAAAEAHLQAALRVSPQDGYLKADYADLLLREGRNTEVINLLHADEQQDNLLLRLAIAGHRLGNADAERWRDEFQARYEAARRDGDFTHLREQARFLLEVKGQAAAALGLAQRNWQVQREPADVRIYAACTTATGNSRAATELLQWIRQTHYQDHALGNQDDLATLTGRQ